MKEKEERRPGRPRKNGNSDSHYNKPEDKRSFNRYREESNSAERPNRFKKEGPSERRFDAERAPKGRTGGFSKEKSAFRGESSRRFSGNREDNDFRKEGTPRRSREDSGFKTDRSFRGEGGFKGDSSPRRSREDSDFRADRGFRREDRFKGESSPRRSREDSGFKKEQSGARGFDSPRWNRERDSERRPGRPSKEDSPYRRDRESGRESRNFSSEKDRFGADRRGSEERKPFKTFNRGKDEPFEYGKGAKPQRRPDYSEENLVKNLPEKQRKNFTSAEKRPTDRIRLNRYIANSGLCSRREADDLIESGQIMVNGQTITEMGYQVQVTDVVKYGRKILNPEKLVYVLLNKPKDFITTTEDPEGRRTVMELVAKAGPERIYPVGRLDRATTGLLLFTNDGELADKLAHPSNEIRKIYQVEIDKPLSKEHFEQLTQGVELEDGFIRPDEVSVVTPDQQVIGIQIHSGKNRVVRRIFEHLGYEVTQLDRTTYAGLTKKDLPRGNWRFLTEKEVIRLKYMI